MALGLHTLWEVQKTAIDAAKEFHERVMAQLDILKTDMTRQFTRAKLAAAATAVVGGLVWAPSAMAAENPMDTQNIIIIVNWKPITLGSIAKISRETDEVPGTWMTKKEVISSLWRMDKVRVLELEGKIAQQRVETAKIWEQAAITRVNNEKLWEQAVIKEWIQLDKEKLSTLRKLVDIGQKIDVRYKPIIEKYAITPPPDENALYLLERNKKSSIFA